MDAQNRRNGSTTNLSHDCKRTSESRLQSILESQEKADKWRNEFLDSLAAARAKANGTTVEAEEKSMKKIERQRQQAHNVKRMRKKGQQSSVNMVFDTDKEGRHERISKDNIEDGCIRENSQ